MNTSNRVFIIALLILGTLFGGARARAQEQETDAQRTARMAWWQDARFGMFIHWGPVSITEKEISWSRERGPNGFHGSTPTDVYDSLYKKFNPTAFDAKQWVAIAQAAGMKYIVFTTKHHDGFCEFDSKLTDYKITSPESPFRRDVVKELADACHQAGMKFGVYYSQPDMHHPDYRTANHARYIEYFHGQVRELLSNYGEISVIWFDGLGGSAADWDAQTLFPMMRQLQPGIIINNRCGLPGDFDTPEQTIGAFQKNRSWESCMTVSAHNHWAWGGSDDGVKDLSTCLGFLISCASGDGNMLLNVGPTPQGEIAPEQRDRIKEMGDWLGKNGESIYGTRGGPFKPGKGIACTCKDNMVYLHVLKWTGETLTLPELPKKVIASTLLTGGDVQMTDVGGQLTFTVQKGDQREIDTIIKLTLDGSTVEIPPLSPEGLGAGLIAPTMKTTASNVYQNDAAYRPEKATDGDPATRWATDAGTRQAWLEVDLGKPVTFDRVGIGETYGRVQSFELQYLDGEHWKPFYKGTTIGEDFLTPRFEAVTAQHIRLNIFDASDGPSINELQLYAAAKPTENVQHGN